MKRRPIQIAVVALASLGLALSSACMGTPSLSTVEGPTAAPALSEVEGPTPPPPTVARACRGEAIPGAATYSADHAPHPLVMISPDGDLHEWNDLLPQAWQPQTLNQVELVACMGPQEERAEGACTYTGGFTKEQLRYEVEGRLVIARTGETLATFRAIGLPAPGCPEETTAFASPPRGEAVNLDQVLPRLAPFAALTSPPRKYEVSVGTPHDIAFSTDGRILLLESSWYAGTASEAGVRDILSGEEAYTVRISSEPISSAVFSPDGNTAAAGDWDGKITVWDNATGQVVHILEEHTGVISALVFSPDSNYLVSGGWDEKVILWDAVTGNELHTLDGYSSPAISPDGKTLAVWNRADKAILWDTGTWNEQQTLSEAEPVSDTIFSPDGKILAYVTSSEAGEETLVLHQMVTGQTSHISLGNIIVMSLAFSPDSKLLAIASCARLAGAVCIVGGIQVWDPIAEQILHTFHEHRDVVELVAFSRDGNILVSASSGEAILWDITALR